MHLNWDDCHTLLKNAAARYSGNATVALITVSVSTSVATTLKCSSQLQANMTKQSECKPLSIRYTIQCDALCSYPLYLNLVTWITSVETQKHYHTKPILSFSRVGVGVWERVQVFPLNNIVCACSSLILYTWTWYWYNTGLYRSVFCRIADRWLVGSSGCTEGKCTSNIKLTMSSDSDDVS